MVLIAVTGWGHEEAREQTEEVGFNAHVLKPVNYPELLKVLSQF